jgi:hypothetical protein
MFTREELQKIEKKAVEMANVDGTNTNWVRAYLRLADACNILDAYMARTEVCGCKISDIYFQQGELNANRIEDK